jgi:hypothetical protein
MNLRYRPEGGGKPEFVHTLNGLGLPMPFSDYLADGKLIKVGVAVKGQTIKPAK